MNWMSPISFHWGWIVLCCFCWSGCKKKDIPSNEVARWMKQLQSSQASERKTAAEALGKLGAQAKDAIPALADALKDEDNEVKYAAAHALGQTRMAHPQVAVGALTRSLKDQDVEMRIAAAKALGNMGMAALAAVSIFHAMVRDPDEDARVKEAVQQALRRLQ